jgi:hypothetical protein
MAKRLERVNMTPAMVATLVSCVAMLANLSAFLRSSWLPLKLALVGGAGGVSRVYGARAQAFRCGRLLPDFAPMPNSERDPNSFPDRHRTSRGAPPRWLLTPRMAPDSRASCVIRSMTS